MRSDPRLCREIACWTRRRHHVHKREGHGVSPADLLPAKSMLLGHMGDAELRVVVTESPGSQVDIGRRGSDKTRLVSSMT